MRRMREERREKREDGERRYDRKIREEELE